MLRRAKCGPPPALLAFVVALAAAAGPGFASAEETVPPGDAARGAGLWKRYCRGCHGVDGEGDGLVFMPHVNNLTKKDYMEQIPDHYLRYVILKGGAAVGKSGYMPAWEESLDAQQVSDLIAHIRALPKY